MINKICLIILSVLAIVFLWNAIIATIATIVRWNGLIGYWLIFVVVTVLILVEIRE